MITQTYSGTLVIEHCYKCGVVMAMPAGFRYKRKQDQREFYCLNGHQQYYPGETDAQRLQRELEATQNELRAANNGKEFWRKSTEAQERKTASAKGQKTKILNRIKKGICPYCNRYFKNLHRHVDSQHESKGAIND